MTAPTPAAERADPDASAGGLDLPVRPGIARFLVLFAVFACAAAGLVYELALVALGSYLLGDTIVQTSIVLSVMVFAMGVGSIATKRLVRFSLLSFAVVEGLLGLVGGLSVLALYLAFAYLNLYTVALVALAFLIGALIGAEIPLLMELLQQIRRQRASAAAADMFAADYVGGLVGGLAFPFVLLPLLGLTQGALVVGMVNALVGVGVVLWLFRRELSRRARVGLAALLALTIGVLGAVWFFADRIEVTAQQRIYRDPIVLSERSEYQQIVVTENLRTRDMRLFLNGDLQFSSLDEYRYHESLVHPALAGARGRVLVLGGGDGLALREVLRYPDVDEVTLVDLDPRVVQLARAEPELLDLNGDSFADPRVRQVSADAFTWLREANDRRYDAVIVDLPDPDDVATAKLYSVEFYGLVRTALADGARVVVQSGSPYFVPRAYWGIEATLRAAGFATTPYHVDVPSFGDWGYFLAAPAAGPDAAAEPGPPVRLAADAPPRRFLTPEVLAAGTVFAPDRDRASAGAPEPSTLLRPRIIDEQRGGWVGY